MQKQDQEVKIPVIYTFIEVMGNHSKNLNKKVTLSDVYSR